MNEKIKIFNIKNEIGFQSAECDKPLVSVITPNWNGAVFLEQTIRSVLDQSYGRIEYIVIDGGSTDGSLEIIDRYKASIAYYHSGPDQGMYQAINKGMIHANGDIVAYLNSDDLYYPETILKVVAVFASNPNIDFIYGRLNYISEDGVTKFSQRFPKFNWKRFANANHSMIGQSAAFWRRDVFKRVGYFNESFRMAGDFEFFIRVGRSGRSMYVDDVLAGFRLHSASLTSRQVVLGHEEVARIHAMHLTQGHETMSKVVVLLSELLFKLLNWRTLPARAFLRFKKKV